MNIYVYTCGPPTKYAWGSTCPWARANDSAHGSLMYMYIYIQHTHDNICIYICIIIFMRIIHI